MSKNVSVSYQGAVAWIAIIGLLMPAYRGQAQLVCDVPEHDFGRVTDGRPLLEHVFEIRNAGTGAVEIVSCEANCKTLNHQLAQYRLKSGESTVIFVSMATEGLSGSPCTGLELRYGSEGCERLALTLKGTIVPPISWSPAVLVLGRVPVGQCVTGTVTLTAERTGPFAIVELAKIGQGFDAVSERTRSDLTQTVRIWMTPQVAGPFSGMVIARTDAAAMPAVPIRFSGSAEPALVWQPTVVDLYPTSGCVSARVSVRAPFGTPFSVIDAGTPFAGLRADVEAQTNGTVLVRLTAESAGLTGSTVLRLRTDLPACPVIEIPVRFRATRP